MSAKTYIQVIVPLKLDWEPVYYVPEGENPVVGDRVSVLFSGKEYLAVVSGTGVTPREGLKEEDILPIIGTDKSLPRISGRELGFWRTMAQYYLCTVGEVYNLVYTIVNNKPPKKWAPKDRSLVASQPALSASEDAALKKSKEAFGKKKTVLLYGGGSRVSVFLALASEAIARGESVMYLVPEIAFSKALEETVLSVFPDAAIYNSGLTPAKKRDIVLEARAGKPMVVLGTRSALWIPFCNLGLIVVDHEQEQSFKQDSPAPRFHVRESAIMLGRAFGANVILGSESPSFESLYNAETGIFTGVELNKDFTSSAGSSMVLLDIASERRKRGMVGSFSLKLIGHLKDAVDKGKKVLAVCPSKASEEDCRKELDAIFPGALDKYVFTSSPFAVKTIPEGLYSVIAILLADVLLGREDFRSDERAVQLFALLSGKTGLLVIQTREPSHPAFSASHQSMMAERRIAGYPPYSRLVSVTLKDIDEGRLNLRSRLLCNRLREVLRPFSDPLILGPGGGEIRIFFKRDKNLLPGKQALYREITSFEKQYSCHVTIDVDPV